MNTSDGLRSVGTIIRERREELGLSQVDLAEKVAMSQEWVTKIETGRIQSPRPQNLKRVAIALGLDLAELMVAADFAKSKREANEAIKALRLNDDSPVWDIVMAGARDLNDEGIEILADIVTTLKKKYSKSGS